MLDRPCTGCGEPHDLLASPICPDCRTPQTCWYCRKPVPSAHSWLEAGKFYHHACALELAKLKPGMIPGRAVAHLEACLAKGAARR